MKAFAVLSFALSVMLSSAQQCPPAVNAGLCTGLVNSITQQDIDTIPDCTSSSTCFNFCQGKLQNCATSGNYFLGRCFGTVVAGCQGSITGMASNPMSVPMANPKGSVTVGPITHSNQPGMTSAFSQPANPPPPTNGGMTSAFSQPASGSGLAGPINNQGFTNVKVGNSGGSGGSGGFSQPNSLQTPGSRAGPIINPGFTNVRVGNPNNNGFSQPNSVGNNNNNNNNSGNFVPRVAVSTHTPSNRINRGSRKSRSKGGRYRRSDATDSVSQRAEVSAASSVVGMATALMVSIVAFVLA